jgi:hypothetical protein
MSEPVIQCPRCRHQLRVPPEFFGQPVQCPKCLATFTAPPPAPSAADDGRAEEAVAADAPPPSRPAWVLIVPAVVLLLCALLGTLENGWQLFQAVTNPEAAEQRIKQQNEAFAAAFAAMNWPAPVPLTLAQLKGMWGGFLALSLLSLLGSAAMLSRRAYGLAIVGGVTSVFNISGCCCLSLPFGLWALVALFDPGVRATFR